MELDCNEFCNWTIKTLEDVLRIVCVLEIEESQDQEDASSGITHNKFAHSSIGLAPFEALHRREGGSPLNWNETGEKKMIEPTWIQQTVGMIKFIKERMKIVQDKQKNCI